MDALARWGEKTNQFLVVQFPSNIRNKKYQNRTNGTMLAQVTTRKRWDHTYMNMISVQTYYRHPCTLPPPTRCPLCPNPSAAHATMNNVSWV